jgi:hypothetical protein
MGDMGDTGFLGLVALSPKLWVDGAILLAALALAMALLRSALMLEDVLSPLVRAIVVALSILPGVAVSAVLVLAAARHPERAWQNLGVAAIVHAAWSAGGMLPRLVRPDVDRDDARWVVLGACITFPVGVAAALAFA